MQQQNIKKKNKKTTWELQLSYFLFFSVAFSQHLSLLTIDLLF